MLSEYVPAPHGSQVNVAELWNSPSGQPKVGTSVGASDGAKVGEIEGSEVGTNVGVFDGANVGASVGSEVGTNVGVCDGANVGASVGSGEGGRVADVMFAEPVVTLAPMAFPTLLEKLGSEMLLDTVSEAEVPSRRRRPSMWWDPISKYVCHVEMPRLFDGFVVVEYSLTW